MAISRVLVEEWLDHLAPEDPEAQRSRRDLVRLNAVMGNFPWVERRVAYHEARAVRDADDRFRVIEMGAGEGQLSRRLAERFPEAEILGIDRMPGPKPRPVNLLWKEEDLRNVLPQCQGDVLIGTMILHHFAEEELKALRAAWSNFRVLLFAEPWRSGWTLVLDRLISPWTGKVTKHDMTASIRAGFLPGELPEYLGLADWEIRETIDLRGVLRLEAWRS